MTIKLNSLSRWKVLEAQSAVLFETSSASERRIRLHLNLESVTSFYAVAGEEQRFLVTAGPGLETIEFNAVGTLSVFAEEGAGAVHYQTAEVEPTYAVVVDPVIFTKIANRRHRNPEMEEMMHRMQINMERRLAQTASEIEQAFERRRREEEHGRSAEIIQSDAPGAANEAGGETLQPQEPPTVEPGVKPAGEIGSKSESGGI